MLRMEGGRGCDALTMRSPGTKPCCSVQAALPMDQGGVGAGRELSPLLGSPPAAGTHKITCSSLELNLGAGPVALGLMDLWSWGKDRVKGEQGSTALGRGRK